jgi:DNA-binding MarR family transcriptional regulator
MNDDASNPPFSNKPPFSSKPYTPGGASRSQKAMGAGASQAPSDRGAPPIGDEVERPKPRFRTLQEFCAEYRPVAEVVEGVLLSGSLYTLTATTGTGKTAWMTTTTLAGVTGRSDILGRRVKQGRYAFCTAENPDGVRMRFSIGCFLWNIDQEAIGRDLLISDNRVRPEEICEYLTHEAAYGPFTGVFIDTWQAFFDGQNESSRTEAVNFTRRFRPLTALPGSPAVVIAAHPTKNASSDDLKPSGGGSTLNEVDGNLTLARTPSSLIELGWQGKLRGNFEPHLFRIDKMFSPDIVDIEGRQVAAPIMLPASAEDAEAREAAIVKKEVRLLKALAENPSASMTELAAKAEIPRGSLTRALTRLSREKPKLIQEKLGKWTVTKAGKEALEEAKTERDAVSVEKRDAERDAET